jgi:hypothetical protein
MVKFSIIIITFNSQYFINGCLNSIFKQKFKDYEVIVIDNASGDNTLEILNKYKEKIKLITNKINLGSAYARNQALELASGQWAISLDADLFLVNNFLALANKVISCLGDNVGMVQPKILNFDRTYINSCGIYLDWWRRFHDLARGEKSSFAYKKAKNIYGATSACCFYRRKMLNQIKDKHGYFDKRLFFLVEDVDLCWRAKKAGWLTYFTPNLCAFHYQAAAPVDSRYRQFLCWRNRYYMIFKNEGLYNYCKKVLPLLLYDIPRFFILLFANSYFRDAANKFVTNGIKKVKHV